MLIAGGASAGPFTLATSAPASLHAQMMSGDRFSAASAMND